MRLVLELHTLRLLANCLLAANGHHSAESDGLLLDGASAVLLKASMEVCAPVRVRACVVSVCVRMFALCACARVFAWVCVLCWRERVSVSLCA